MKDEIKEILDYFKKYVNDKYETYTVVDKHTNYLRTLLDYITNLQEENNINKVELRVVRKDYKEYMKKALHYQEYLQQEKEDYKLRIEKAIDYITTEQLYTNYQWGKSQYVKILKDLLNILQGEDKK